MPSRSSDPAFRLTPLCAAILGGLVLSTQAPLVAAGNHAKPIVLAHATKAGNPCRAKRGCNPCNPCTAKKGCNPCAAKKGWNPCTPCAAKKGCNPCNPCAAKRGCNPCAADATFF